MYLGRGEGERGVRGRGGTRAVTLVCIVSLLFSLFPLHLYVTFLNKVSPTPTNNKRILITINN